MADRIAPTALIEEAKPGMLFVSPDLNPLDPFVPGRMLRRLPK